MGFRPATFNSDSFKRLCHQATSSSIKIFFNEKLKGLKIYFDDNLPFPTVLKQLFLVQILNRDSVVIEKN